MRTWQTILHPTDLSESSQCALELAKDVARHSGARLILLHVVPPLRARWAGYGTDPHEDLRRAHAALQKLDCGDLQPERMLRSGGPAPVIVNVAERVGADLIVIGQPQPSKWRWLAEDRVAETLGRIAPCSVLIAARSKVATEANEKALPGEAKPVPKRLMSGRERSWLGEVPWQRITMRAKCPMWPTR